ncbi:MAG: hypothetical protein LKK51_01550 [Eubacterium sp.]|jgi:hypothetical protein|uniref:hypothetical protein n=1 Tax=Eubacterium sp. F2 TaxID=3381348 RepID=UPI0039083006|nr:hypothetical protein [Eubacterium sp.]
MTGFSSLKDSWKGIIAFTAALVLQPFLHSLFPGIQTPNIILMLTAALTMVYADNLLWMVMGMIYALLEDAVFGLFLGIGMVSTFGVILLILFTRHLFNSRSALVALIVSILVTLVYSLLYWGLAHAASSPYSFMTALKTMPEQIAENTIVFMLIYWRLSVDEHKRNKKNWYI